MRPRTVTLEVSKNDNTGEWVVTMGNPSKATPLLDIRSKYLDDALVSAILQWAEKEGLDERDKLL